MIDGFNNWVLGQQGCKPCLSGFGIANAEQRDYPLKDGVRNYSLLEFCEEIKNDG